VLDENAASEVLANTCSVIKSMGLTHWIDSGTLLSAYRDGGINVYDHDIDVRMLLDEVSEETETELIKRLWSIGYRSIANLQNRRAQILASHPRGTGVLLDLKFCEQDDKDVWYYCWKEPDPTPSIHIYPIKFFKNMGQIELMGNKYPCPTPVEEYIKYHYGDEWRLFKVRAEDAEETDLSWDYMKDPPCSMSLPEFITLKSSR